MRYVKDPLQVPVDVIHGQPVENTGGAWPLGWAVITDYDNYRLCEPCAHTLHDEAVTYGCTMRFAGRDEEVDAPVHCDDCGTLLGAPLTRDGLEYVLNAAAAGVRVTQIVREWLGHYATTLTEYLDTLQCADARRTIEGPTAPATREALALLGMDTLWYIDCFGDLRCDDCDAPCPGCDDG